MSQVSGTIEAISTKYDKFSILIDEVWYSTKQEWAPSPLPNRGDTVTFDNGGKKFIKKLSIVGAGAAANGGGGAASRGSSGNLGVEVGHAANLAIQIVNGMATENNFEVGDEAYYKEFTKATQNMYRLMKGIRKSIENEASSAAAMDAEVKSRAAKSDDSDLF